VGRWLPVSPPTSCFAPASSRDTLSRAVTTAAAVDLSVQVGALRLRNPILAASGTFGYGIEFAHLVDLNLLGGFVTKGLSREPIDGAPPPRIIETPSGMLNAIGLQNVGVRAFVTEKLPVLRKYVVPVLANVFGYTLEDYVEVIRTLEDNEGLAGYELNISCPNVKKGGMQFGCDPGMVSEVVSAARKAAVRRPLWVKLSPLVTDIRLTAHAAAEAGADALTVANTYPAMAIDFRTGRSRLGNATGGLSGPATKPITLKLVWDVRRAVEIPVIGLGGVEKVEDVLDYLSVGASAVQVGTANFANPMATQHLVYGLEEAVSNAKSSTIRDIVTRFHTEIG
jgi:dihydroorotate dehydrogenase (NAD+) catalytic subunit